MENENFQLEERKSDHIRINLNEDVTSGITNGLENFRFIHEALPDVDLEDICMGSTIFNKLLRSPLFISSMVGGTEKAGEINRNLAVAAQEHQIGMGLGSMRIALDTSEKAATFMVRKYAPDILLFANLGAVQLNYGYSEKTCLKLVEMVEADGLILHLNSLQEAVQPEGDTNFAGLINKIESICKILPVPVVVKEVGWGISGATARRLVDAGVTAIDVAGAGGTSWSQVEMHRSKNEIQARLASGFKDWGIPTAESIIQVVKSTPGAIIFASGGIHNGIEIAKCLSLGASLCGMAGKLLQAANESSDEVVKELNIIIRQLQVTMFAVGAANLEDLKKVSLIEIPYR